MSETTPEPLGEPVENTQTPAETTKPRGRETNSRSRKAATRCEVCGVYLRRLTAEHLRGHGLTRERYRRIFVAAGADPTTYSGSSDQRLAGSLDPDQVIALLADKVAGSAALLDTLGTEVADHILNAAPLRQGIAFAAAQIIQARMAIHADAVGRLSRLTEELGEDWRITQGGANGKPTPTKDLVGMAMQAHAEIVKAEEMVLKAARLAMDERKAVSDQAVPGFAYSGAAESIAIPRDLSPSDREGLRALMGNLTKYVEQGKKVREAITVAGSSAPASTDPVGTSMPPTDPVETDPLRVTTRASSSRPSRRRRRRITGSLPPTDPVSQPSADPPTGGVNNL